MANRPSGRPKAHNPRDVRVTIRLTEKEADDCFRILGRGEALADLLRRGIAYYVSLVSGELSGQSRRDTEEARLQRARRAARRANAMPQPALEAQIGQALQATGEDLAADAAAPVG
jgi:hypothetical protein